MAILGSINLVMRAATKQFDKGIDGARGKLDALGKSITSTKGMVTGLIGAFAASAAVSSLSESLGKIDETGDTAQRLGLTTEAFTRLQYATELTGSHAEDLAPALQKMNSNLSDAAAKGGPAADALKRLGLDAKELATMRPDEAFRKISDAFSNVDTMADRAALAMDLFGKGGVAVLNTLGAGSAELNRLGAEASSLGAAFDDAAAAQAGAANDALFRLSSTFDGLKNTIAVSLAPYITDIAERVVEFGKQGFTAGWIVSKSMDAISQTLKVAADVLDTFRLGWKGFMAYGHKAISKLIEGLSFLAKGLDYVLNTIPGMSSNVSGFLADIARQTDALANDDIKGFWDAMAAPPTSSGIQDWFDAIRNGANKAADAVDNLGKKQDTLSLVNANLAAKVQDFVDKLRLEIATFGMSSREAEIYKLKKEGATEAQLKSAQSLSKELEGMELTEKFMSPLQKAIKDVSKAFELLKSGNINALTFNRVLNDATDSVVKGDKQGSKFAGALDANSVEARSAILNAAIAPQQDSGKQLVGLMKESLSVQKKQLAAQTQKTAAPVIGVGLGGAFAGLGM